MPFRKARSFDVHVSGGEYNVAADLSDCFGLRTGIATAMVNYGIGELVQTRVRETGVTPFYKWFEHDGVRGPNIATVYSDRGHGVRPPVVFYNRANEAGALLKPGDFDWPKIFAGGVRWFHSGGIFAALSETTSELILEGMQAAKAAGAITSFDLNYRAKLWASVGGLERGQQVLRRIVGNVDALIGNEEDLQKGLGIAGPTWPSRSKLDPGHVLPDDRPRCRAVSQHQAGGDDAARGAFDQPSRLGGRVWLEGQRFVSPTCHLDVLDRIGGGDGFASGFIYGLIAGRPPRRPSAGLGARGAADHLSRRCQMATAGRSGSAGQGGSARVQR